MKLLIVLLFTGTAAFAGFKNPPQQLCTVKSFDKTKAKITCGGELYDVDKSALRPETKGPLMANQRVYVWAEAIKKNTSKSP